MLPSMKRYLSEEHQRVAVLGVILAVIGLVGWIDFVTPRRLSFAVFYLGAVGISAWYTTRAVSYVVGALCVVVSSAGDIQPREAEFSGLVLIWNALTALSFYVIISELLRRLRKFTHHLERLVAKRTTALSNEITQRKLLEREILDLAEGERHKLGQDLHDGLCQHLTAISLAGKVLEERLRATSKAESEAAATLVELLQEGIHLCRNIAKGLYPLELDGQGLMNALEVLVNTHSSLSGIPCLFECDAPVIVSDRTAANHLYRIAQEALTNALKHSNATSIKVSLENTDSGLQLAVHDDGKGCSAGPGPNEGLGVRIMKHRADIIGAQLIISDGAPRGTVVTCFIADLEDERTHEQSSPLTFPSR